MLYEGTKPDPRGNGPLLLTPLELLDRLAALVPPPRVHRHRYFGVLAPNSPLRAAVTALASTAITPPPAPTPQPTAEPADRRAARYAWALLLARIYEVFPLLCPLCGAETLIPKKLGMAWWIVAGRSWAQNGQVRHTRATIAGRYQPSELSAIAMSVEG